MNAVASRPRLHVRALFRETWRVYRRHWRWLMTGALLVFLPLAMIDGLVEELKPDDLIAEGGISLLTTFEHMVGDVLFNGLVAAAVLEWREGRRRLGIVEVARTLPWVTILALEALLPVVTTIGLILLVVPGLVFVVYSTLAPAAAKVEHLRAWPSVKRSFRLVHGNAWRVFLVLLILVGVAAAAEELLQSLTHHFIGHVAAKLIVELAFSPLSAVAVVLMVFHLRREGE
jgi:hypothetical protein